MVTERRGGSMTIAWAPCRVVGIDASRETPAFIVEYTDGDGSIFLSREDEIRRRA